MRWVRATSLSACRLRERRTGGQASGGSVLGRTRGVLIRPPGLGTSVILGHRHRVILHPVVFGTAVASYPPVEISRRYPALARYVGPDSARGAVGNASDIITDLR